MSRPWRVNVFGVRHLSLPAGDGASASLVALQEGQEDMIRLVDR